MTQKTALRRQTNNPSKTHNQLINRYNLINAPEYTDSTALAATMPIQKKSGLRHTLKERSCGLLIS